jgi:WD40 repeat protein
MLTLVLIPSACDIAVLFPPAGHQLLASGAKDCEVRVWDPRSGSCLGAGAGHIGAVAAVALARSKAKGGSFLVSAGADKLLKVWDTSKALEAAAAAGVEGAGGLGRIWV